MRRKWLIGVFFTLFCAAPANGHTGENDAWKAALDECVETFTRLTANDDIWLAETFCDLDLQIGRIEFGVNKTGAYRVSELMKSDLTAYALMYAPDGYFLQPTSDERTYGLGARIEGQDDLVYLFDEYGGMYHFAHFIADRVIWIRCNEQLGSCVYYGDLLVPTQLTDRWGIERNCRLRWTIVFPAPSQDDHITTYMDAILPFTERFAELTADQLILGCLRPSQRPDGAPAIP